MLSPIKIPTIPMKTPRCRRFARRQGYQRQDEFDLAQARKNPKNHAKRGGNGEAIKNGVIRSRKNAAICQKLAAREHFRIVKRERSNQLKHKAHDEPQNRAAQQREQRHATGGVHGGIIFISLVH